MLVVLDPVDETKGAFPSPEGVVRGPEWLSNRLQLLHQVGSECVGAE